MIFSCDSALAVCPAVSGQNISCKGYTVENEADQKFFCSDGSGNPHEYFKACAPQSGFCPATGAP
ncbi:MAG: hypothetical protein IPJ65_18090 [Archangiaceae bacterium]|nr:hypothetical protein [Archangiaceae bacterium]